MSDLDPGRLLDTTEGDGPSADFVARLRTELDLALSGETNADRAEASALVDIDTVHEPEEQDMSRNWKPIGLIGAAAAVIALIVGIAITSGDDDDTDSDRVDVVDDPSGPESDPSDDDAAPDPEPDAPEPAPVTFSIEVLEVADPGLAVDDGTFGWVVGSNGTLTKVDLATDAVVDTYDIPPGADIPDLGPDSIWITYVGEDKVVRVDLDTGEVVATITGVGLGIWIDATPDAVWVNGTGELVEIDPATNEIVRRVPVNSTITGSNYFVGGHVWTGTESGYLRVDPESGEIDTLDETCGCVVDDQGAWLSGLQPSVRRYDLDSLELVAEIQVAGPDGEETRVAGLMSAGGSIWARFSYTPAGATDPVGGVARIDPETNTVVATAELRAEFGALGAIMPGVAAPWVPEGLVVFDEPPGPGLVARIVPDEK